MWRRARPLLNETGLYDQWFFGGGGVLYWTGFQVGYHIVRDYLARHRGSTAASTSQTTAIRTAACLAVLAVVTSLRPRVFQLRVPSIGLRLGARTVVHPESTAYCPATNRATAAFVMTPLVTPTHASPACSTAG